MRLRYDTSIAADLSPLVLTGPDDLRVEIHIRRDEDDSATLLAFSGRDGDNPPAKTIQQGPYQSKDEAIAAKRAITAQLKDAGFALAEQQQPQWSLAVQRAINSIRQQKESSAVNYRFDPKDVFLDW